MMGEGGRGMMWDHSSLCRPRRGCRLNGENYISGVGLRSLWAAGQGPPRTYLPSDHPLFGPPGLSEQRPGALTVAQAPPALVGTVEPCDALPDGLDVLRRDCGVWP